MITRSRGHDLSVHSRSFSLTDQVRWGFSGLRNIKPSVGEKQARGIPALHRAAKLRAEAVASLNLYCWRGDGPTRQRVDTVWQAKLFRNGPQASMTNPVQTRFTFWETVEESLAWRGNAYIWKTPGVNPVSEWWALHPDQVTARYDGDGTIKYEVRVEPGYVDPVGNGKGKYVVDESTILHIRGHGEGGQLSAPSPIEVFKQALEGPIGRQRHEARMWRRGTAIQQAVQLPANVGKEQADQWREVWRSNYEGADGETTVVLGGGMEIKPIGMTMQDAQFVEMYDLTAKDASSIMGVPANLLGVQVTNVRSNLEDDLMAWLRFGLGPELSRIEEALYADEDLFGGSQTMPGFDTSDFVRGDLQTETAILVALVQAGINTPNEARHKLGYERDDSPESDQLQVTPVGGKENPVGVPKLAPATEPQDSTESTGERSLVEIPRIGLNVDVDTAPLARELGSVIRETIDEQSRVNASVLRSAAQERAAAAREAREAEVRREERRRDERAQEAAELRERDERLAAALERDLPVPVVSVDTAPVAEALREIGAAITEKEATVIVNTDDDSGPERKKVSVERGPGGFITGMTIEEE